MFSFELLMTFINFYEIWFQMFVFLLVWCESCKIYSHLSTKSICFIYYFIFCFKVVVWGWDPSKKILHYFYENRAIVFNVYFLCGYDLLWLHFPPKDDKGKATQKSQKKTIVPWTQGCIKRSVIFWVAWLSERIPHNSRQK